ncbi:MAG: hypothetical protein LC808_13885 [Actinobacteria bacterium]|nr:hypothetical protein [Actinomycetota bacterium]
MPLVAQYAHDSNECQDFYQEHGRPRRPEDWPDRERGRRDAIGWLPTANAEEISEILFAHKRADRTVFIHAGHTLATYWGCAAEEDGHPVGDVDPHSEYGRGFMAGMTCLGCNPNAPALSDQFADLAAEEWPSYPPCVVHPDNNNN